LFKTIKQKNGLIDDGKFEESITSETDTFDAKLEVIITKAKHIIDAQIIYLEYGNKKRYDLANEQIPTMEDAGKYIKQIKEALNDVDNEKINLTTNQINSIKNLSYAYANYQFTTKCGEAVAEALDSVDNGTVNKIIQEQPGLMVVEQTVVGEEINIPIAKLNTEQQGNDIEERKEEAKFVAQKLTEKRKSNWCEKQKHASRTSSLASHEERKEQPRLKREGSIGSISRLGYGLTESRDAKGSSTQRTYTDAQTGASYTSRHDNIKEVTKRLGHSRSSSRLSHEDQIKKREASLNKKFGGMSFGK
jgi:hypothetical protein